MHVQYTSPQDKTSLNTEQWTGCKGKKVNGLQGKKVQTLLGIVVDLHQARNMAGKSIYVVAFT